MVDFDKDRASHRYRLLVEQLGAELDHMQGWKTRVAERLGVSPGYISKVLRGDATAVTMPTLEKAMAALQLLPRFFFDDLKGDPLRFREHVVSRPRGHRDILETVDIKRWRAVLNTAAVGVTGPGGLAGPPGTAFERQSTEETARRLALELVGGEPMAAALRLLLFPSGELSREDLEAFFAASLALAESILAGHAALMGVSRTNPQLD